MASASVESAGEDGTNWVEFCEKHARAAASNFAKSFICYVNSHNPNSSTLEHREFLSKFIDSFVEHFESELLKLKDKPNLTNGIAGPSGVNGYHEEHNDYFDSEAETRSPKLFHKPFFRRLSFKALKKGKGFFYRQVSDENDTSNGLTKSIKFDKHSKTRLAKIVVECRKEGIVNYLIGENPDGTQKWERCRLALVKTIGGYMLEFYSPPKSVKPKSGVFCFLITEARETTALEMPDHENTFVLKADNNMEYVIEAYDIDDMRSWLATVKYCMRSVNTGDSGDNQSLLGSSSEAQLHGKPSCTGELEDPPELPPRLQDGATSNSNFELCSSQAEGENQEPEIDLSVTLQEYPWFHGTLPRAEAASLVLSTGTSGHGVFLVRQSETRKGEFVLTFNFHGRAKHLRMTINDTSQCRVQHLWFGTIFDMLEHFRQHPIPLESGGTADVTLTQYVVAAIQSPLSNLRNQGSAHTERRPPPTPEQREIIIHGGSIRTRTESMERVQETGSGGSVTSVVGGRAIENTYSFV
uniref:Putative signal transduction protein n=1 Tax=Rhodnius prolixus TaxID=13249 RepID=A0A4V0Y8J5_RHOPR